MAGELPRPSTHSAAARRSRLHHLPVLAVRVDLPRPHSSTPAAAATAPVQARRRLSFPYYWKASLVSARNYAMPLVSEKTDWAVGYNGSASQMSLNYRDYS